MVSRRKYRQPQGYREGGAVPETDIIVADVLPAEPAPSPEPAPAPDSAGDALVHALAAQQRAEALQKQAQHKPSIEHVIDSIPGLTEHKKQFLREHPEVLQNAPAARFAHQAAMASGIEDDTPAMNAAILDGLARERQWAVDQAKSAAALRPPTIERSKAQDAARLAGEAQSIAAISNAMGSTPAALAGEIAEQPQPPRKRTMAFSAPVSREVPSVSGNRQPSDWNTLTAAEVEIAHNSFSDPNMTRAEKELSYLRQKQRLIKMRADGAYPERERN